MTRRKFIKRGALFVPTLFFPKLIRAQTPLKSGGTTKLVAGPGSRVSRQEVLSGLVGWWKFNEGTGTSAADSSGSGNTGTLTGGPTWTNALYGGLLALSFDGTDDYVTMGNVLDQTGTTPFSISCWFKTSYSGTNPQTVVCKNTISSPYPGYQLGFNIVNGDVAGTGKIGLFLVNNGNSSSEHMGRLTATTWNDGKWHHAVATYDGSKNRSGMLLYVDGNLQSMEDYVSPTITGSITTTSSFEVGARDGANQPFNGQADDVRFYSLVLALNEIQLLFTNGPQ